MTHGSYKDLIKKTEPDKVLRDKTFKIASDTRHDSYQGELLQCFTSVFDKKSSGDGVVKNKSISSGQLKNELYK